MVEDRDWFDEIENEYKTLEKYVKERDRSGAEPLLFGYYPFNYLFSKGLLKERDVVRTNLEENCIDGHYEITSDGKLKGIDAANGVYPGEKGVFEPEEVLNLERSNNGWTLGMFAKSRINLSDKL